MDFLPRYNYTLLFFGRALANHLHNHTKFSCRTTMGHCQLLIFCQIRLMLYCFTFWKTLHNFWSPLAKLTGLKKEQRLIDVKTHFVHMMELRYMNNRWQMLPPILCELLCPTGFYQKLTSLFILVKKITNCLSIFVTVRVVVT